MKIGDRVAFPVAGMSWPATISYVGLTDVDLVLDRTYKCFFIEGDDKLNKKGVLASKIMKLH